MRYPYTRIGPYLPLRPYLQIVLRNGFATSPQLYGLVDSGADYSVFPYGLAKYLKLELDNAPIWNFQGTTGKPQSAYLATVEVNILSRDLKAPDFQFQRQSRILHGLRVWRRVLLGQNGLMSEFKTCFFQPENFFEIEPLQFSVRRT